MSQSGALTGSRIAWRPGPDHLRASRLLRFERECGFDDHAAFIEWSIRDPEGFWSAVVRDLDLRFDHPFTQVVDDSRGVAWTRWWRGGRYNYVHNALDKRALGDDAERICLRWEGDDGATRTWTCAELLAETERIAAGLSRWGVKPGDRVGLYLPMMLETVAALLAIGKVGAVAVPIFSGFGPDAVAQRLADCGARLLFTADAFLRRGKRVGMKEQADLALQRCTSVEGVVVVPRLGESAPMTPGRDHRWSEFGAPSDSSPTRVDDPEHPALILYTSGTTGKPKGAVHPHGGFPIKATQDMAHLFDVGRGDTLLWYTDLGWMMGPWALIGALTLGATCVLFEGTPDFPDPDRIWRVAERHGVTVLGIAPTAIRALMAHGDRWPAACDLSRLRILGSSGEPWNPAPWHWFVDVIGGGRCPMINYSGGTEVSGGILGCVSFLPLKPCGFNTIVPGMGAAVMDETGRRVRDQVGELVLTNASPGMTRGFWQDSARYESTYWSRWPGVWVHGDWAIHGDDDHWFILGRSDDTLNIAGKRIGPAEYESAACGNPAVREAAAVGVPDPVKGEVVVLFVVPADPAAWNDAARAEIAETVAASLGKALRPSRVLRVTDLPKTRNGKILRRLIRRAHLNEPLGDLASLENPATLDAIRNAE